MKHTVGILAHKNPNHLRLLIHTLESMDMRVIVHIDKKSDLETALTDLSNRCITKRFDVQRGHISIVYAALALMKEATKEEFDYFHLISGDCFVIKSREYIDKWFSTHSEIDFINGYTLPVDGKIEKRSPVFNGFDIFYDRLPKDNYMFPFFKNGVGLVDTFHYQESSIAGKLIAKFTRFRTFVRLYHTLFKRNLPQLEYKAGSAWFSLTKRSVDYIVKKSETEGKLLDYMRHSLFPDEIYFHTLLNNWTDKTPSLNTDLRHIKWGNSNDFGPNELTSADFDEFSQSPGIFARKLNFNKEVPKPLNNILWKNL